MTKLSANQKKKLVAWMHVQIKAYKAQRICFRDFETANLSLSCGGIHVKDVIGLADALDISNLIVRYRSAEHQKNIEYPYQVEIIYDGVVFFSIYNQSELDERGVNYENL